MDGGDPAKGVGEDPDRSGPWRNFKNPYPEANNPNMPQVNSLNLRLYLLQLFVSLTCASVFK